MDLSKLYYEKELDAQQKLDADRIVEGWGADGSKVIGRDVSKEFTNIKMKSVPAYLFKFEFQKVERHFTKEERAYKGERDFPQNPLGLHDVSFDEYALDDIPVSENAVRPEEDDTVMRLLDTLALHTCPDCKGQGKRTCKKCGGRGWVPCSNCRDSGRIGYIKREIKQYQSVPGTGHSNWRLGPEGGTWEYVDCPKCVYSQYGRGKQKCSCDNGIEKCSRCKTTGKVVTFIGRKDRYAPVSLSSTTLWHEAISDRLKAHMNSNDLLSYAEPMPLNDSDEALDAVGGLLAAKGLTAVREKYDEMLAVAHEQNDGDAYTEDDTERILSKITKVRVRVYRINLTYMTYECNAKKYELWLYGKSPYVFTQDNPFMAAAKLYESQAANHIEKKHYERAVRPLEEACKVAHISRNPDVFEDYAKQLKTARKKSNRPFTLGTLAGMIALGALFFIVPDFFSGTAAGLKAFFDIQDEKTLSVAAKIVDILANVLVPAFFSLVLFVKVIRHRLPADVLRFFCATLLPIAISLALGFFSAHLPLFSSEIYFYTSCALCICGIVLACAVKAPYHNYKMAEIADEKSTADAAQNDTDDNEETVSQAAASEVSPKHRAVAALLAFFLGYVGVHRFYAGRVKSGLVQLAAFFASALLISGTEGKPESVHTAAGAAVMGFVCIWVFTDFILICAGKFKDKHGARIKNW